jgi:hypothetical protein
LVNWSEATHARFVPEDLKRQPALPLDTVAAADEARHAIGFQLSSEDPHVSGGFSFGRKFGKCLPFVNPASSAFCAQALTLWEDHKNNPVNADPQSLI